ncbi:MAG: YebC/PmpR family DNA-binding transcriptional regulator, partial [Oscillospiraceae bacterium]
LIEKGYTLASAEAEMVPDTYTTLSDENHIKKMNLLLDLLEENDDVQNVWHNWDNEE